MPRSGLARASGSGSSRGSRFEAGCAAGHYPPVESNATGSPSRQRATWSFLGAAAGAIGVGVTGSRFRPAAGRRRRPRRRGALLRRPRLSWHKGETFEIAEATASSTPAQRPPHAACAGRPRRPRLRPARLRRERALPTARRVAGRHPLRRDARRLAGRVPIQFVREAELGPPEPRAEPAPSTIVNLRDVEPSEMVRPRIHRTRRNLGKAVGSVTTGLQHVEVAPGMASAPFHCHSLEEELFVVLDGDGTLRLGDEEIPVRPGHVVSRPPGTGVAHTFRGGDSGLTYLAYGTREPGDACFYPDSNKVLVAGVAFASSRSTTGTARTEASGRTAPPRPAHAPSRRRRPPFPTTRRTAGRTRTARASRPSAPPSRRAAARDSDTTT